MSKLISSCPCGQVQFEVTGPPILATTCCCGSCQAAAQQFAELPGAPPVLDEYGGTEFLMYRKDRVQCRRGAELLRDYRLQPSAPTRRVVATCCGAPMFLEMHKGHWLSMYRHRFHGDAVPPIELRVMTKYRRAGVELPNDVPNYAVHSVGFMAKLLAAWVAMGFRAPRVTYGNAAAAPPES